MVIEVEKKFFKPKVVSTHQGGAVNINHLRSFDAGVKGSRLKELEELHAIITIGTMSCTKFGASSAAGHSNPNLVIEISREDLLVKSKAMESYEFERGAVPYPRSPEVLEMREDVGVIKHRGMAEALQMVRSIQKA